MTTTFRRFYGLDFPTASALNARCIAWRALRLNATRPTVPAHPCCPETSVPPPAR